MWEDVWTAWTMLHLTRLCLVRAGREQEELAIASGFERAVHYELAFGLMGCLVATKRR